MPVPVGNSIRKAPPAQFQRVVQCPHRLCLVRAYGAGFALADVVFRNYGRRQGPPVIPHLDRALEVPLREEAGDGAGVVVPVVPEVRQLAVGQKNEGGVERLRVGQCLLFRNVWINGVFLCLDNRERAAAAVIEDVVGSTVH